LVICDELEEEEVEFDATMIDMNTDNTESGMFQRAEAEAELQAGSVAKHDQKQTKVLQNIY
jgi:hypothetical protein